MKERPPHILLLSHSPEISGATGVLLRVAKVLDKAGYRLTLCFPDDGPAPRKARLQGRTVHVIPNPQISLATGSFLEAPRILLSRLKFMRRIRRFVKRGDFDLIYLNSSACIHAGLALLAIPVPVIWHLHETPGASFMDALKRFYIPRRAQTAIFLSQNHQKALPIREKCGRAVLPNAVDIEPFAKKSDSAIQEIPRVGTLSYHIGHPKGTDVFMKACVILAQRGIRIRAIMAGDRSRTPPDFLTRLERIEHEAGSRIIFEFPGPCQNAADYLNSLTLFIHPSRREAMPLVILEAMASSRAIVATDVGAVKEILDPPHCGVVVKKGDAEALADEMEKLLKTPPRIRELGQKARERAVKIYSHEAFEARLIKIIEDVIGSE